MHYRTKIWDYTINQYLNFDYMAIKYYLNR